MVDLTVTNAVFALLRTAFVYDAVLSRDDAEIIKSNINEIYQIAKRNDIAHLVGFALDQQGLITPDDAAFEKFQKRQYLAVYRCEGMEYEIERIKSTFESNGITFILLKGAVIRGLYPEGWMRTSSDIDVLVHPEDLERAEAALIGDLEYEKGVESVHDHSLHTAGGVHVELHFDLIADGSAKNSHEVLLDVWNNARPRIENRFEHQMSNEMFYCYHIAHIAKHMQYAGSGIRPFIDLWLINRSLNYDADRRVELLERCALEKFSSLCDELSAYWMGDLERLSELASKLEVFVLNCGVYGSEENRIAIHRKDGGNTFKYILMRLFYPFDELKRIYPILNKHKWLAPFCQMRRWLKLITGEKTSKAIKEIKRSRETTKEDIEYVRSFLSEMGVDPKQ